MKSVSIICGGLAILGAVSLLLNIEMLWTTTRVTVGIKNYTHSNVSTIESTSVTEQNDKVLPQQSCLGLGSEEDLDNFLSKYEQVFVIMPAKAAGSSMKTFTRECMQSVRTSDASLNRIGKTDNVILHHEKHEELFKNQLNLPSLISSHVSLSSQVCRLVKHATKQSLIIWIHREESSRLDSAIRFVVVARYFKDCSANHCKIEEETLYRLMRTNHNEIHIGTNEVWTCETYNCVKDSRPNLVFMHYKKASQLQKLLAKHHCPNFTKNITINTKSRGKRFSVVVGDSETSDGTRDVDLDDWINAKIQLLQYFFLVKKTVSCVGTTREIEDDLFACPDETLQISGRSLENRRIPFPF